MTIPPTPRAPDAFDHVLRRYAVMRGANPEMDPVVLALLIIAAEVREGSELVADP